MLPKKKRCILNLYLEIALLSPSNSKASHVEKCHTVSLNWLQSLTSKSTFSPSGIFGTVSGGANSLKYNISVLQ